MSQSSDELDPLPRLNLSDSERDPEPRNEVVFEVIEPEDDGPEEEEKEEQKLAVPH